VPGCAPPGTVAATVPLVTRRVGLADHIGVPFQEKLIGPLHG
jgi:hypothetical protein